MASDYLLEIDGIKGESHDDKHKEWIEVSSFSWGASNAGAMGSGGGGGTGKVNFSDISFTSTASKASPVLAQSCATGKHHSKATVMCRKQGGTQAEYYKLILTDVLVTSISDSGGGGGEVMESFSLNFAQFEFDYSMQDEKGAVGAPVVFKYNVKANKAG